MAANTSLLAALRLVGITVVLFVSSCNYRSCRKQEEGRKQEGKNRIAQDATETQEEGKRTHTTMPPLLPEAEITSAAGGYRVIRSKVKSKYPMAAEQNENALFIGDTVEAEAAASIEISLASGGKVRLEGPGGMTIGRHYASEVVVSGGRIILETEQLRGRLRRVRVQTPAGTYYHAGPASEVTVAVDGAVRIFVRDCPAQLPVAAAGSQPSTAERVVSSECSILYSDEERPLTTGDLVVVSPAIEVTVQHGYSEKEKEAMAWMEARHRSFEKEGAAAANRFVQWLPVAIEKLDGILAELERLGSENKRLIETLKKLREGAAPQEGGEEEALSKKVEETKRGLAANAKNMARFREILVARWYQLQLRWQLLRGVLTDEVLSKAKKDRSVMEAFISSYDEKILRLVERRPRRKMPTSIPTSFFQKMVPPLPHKETPAASP